MFAHEHVMPLPHHETHHPIHPMDRHALVSVIYDSEKLKATYGELWSYHVDKIALEPPEMKILFAIEMGFKVSTNQRMIEALLRQRNEEAAAGITSHGFTNAALNEEALQSIGSAVSISQDEVAAILDHAPDGVVSTIIAAAKRE